MKAKLVVQTSHIKKWNNFTHVGIYLCSVWDRCISKHNKNRVLRASSPKLDGGGWLTGDFTEHFGLALWETPFANPNFIDFFFFFTHICQRTEEHFPCFSSISDFPSKWLNFVTMPQCKHRVSCRLWMGQKREESLSAKLLPNLFFFFFAKTFVQVSFQGCDSEMTGF